MKLESKVALLMLVVAVLGCNLGKRLKRKPQIAAKPCFTRPVADTNPYARALLNSEDGGFTVYLPAGFPAPSPPEEIKPGHEYGGRTYYSYKGDCRSSINFTEIAATSASGKSDDAVLADRRELATFDAYHPSTLNREEHFTVQNHRAMSIYTSGVGSDDREEYSRYLMVVARGRVYEARFLSGNKEELDHPEVSAFMSSFTLQDELDSQAISKPNMPSPPAGFPRQQATIVVEVIVGSDGRVKEAKAISGPIIMRSIAEQAARKARFKPAKEERKGLLTYRQ